MNKTTNKKNSFPNDDFWNSLENIFSGLSTLIKNIISALSEMGIISYNLSLTIRIFLSSIVAAINSIFERQKHY
ncbi:hypothetical protein Xsto_00983 [Xenorhabdus stockiae]|uniref:Uncharacterized protein n=1 Tax=Xenorhabdus stockiae TaxID=351614 RepID=A0A2D0KT98_9GAMM|nr:hypothetical protein [Xenorhabdus stockiae]PHM66654.1 hypothetical protein Xsto_00983 [Xenorhabdus stockiae]